jgi:5'-deoxynucleotidase
MEHHDFFAYLSRMRYIARWGLMRNTFQENIQEHSHMVAVLAHALAVIRRDVFGKPASPDAAAAAALFHDASEILTGDLPTPVKYHNPEIREAYRLVEDLAADKLLAMLPEPLRASYRPLLHPGDPELWALIKAADKLAAHIKCLEELKAGNNEFRQAAEQTREVLASSPLPEVQYFIEHFLPAFSLSLDELH